MINLYFLCADLKNRQSSFRKKSNRIITEIFGFLNQPSRKTKELIEGWKEDFKYIYGDITTNLSSNSKFNKEKFLQEYGICQKEDSDREELLQMLFFSIQTYFSLLIKYIMKNLLQEIQKKEGFTYQDVILGSFAEAYGITNYGMADWYCWPVFELQHGFEKVMEEMYVHIEEYASCMEISEFQLNNNYDFIKQIYEAIIPKEFRHALGEYYTPDWLAEATLKRTVDFCGSKVLSALSMIDPTCGSGTFLMKAISMKRRKGCTLEELLATIKGMDLNPLAVLTAKTNYVLSILDLLGSDSTITIPIYHMDILALELPVNSREGESFTEAENPAEAVRDYAAQDRGRVQMLERADIILGNPPWVNWEYMPEQYRQKSQHLWMEYQLFSAKGRDLSFSKEDISVLITYIVMDKLLKQEGILGFVIRQGVFKSVQNGAGFRRFRIRAAEPIKVLRVEDLSKLRVFEGAMNSTALFFAEKGRENQYPVPYFLWEKRSDLKKCSFGAYSNLQEVMAQVSITEQCALPAVKKDPVSLWITAEKTNLEAIEKVLGTNSYRARTGVFTGGANAVYWLQLHDSNGNTVFATNIVERAKRKVEQITMEIEKDYIFPMLKGSNVRKWKVAYDQYLLCPHTAETKMWPIPQQELSKTAPKTGRYLKHFKANLDSRSGFAGWEKEIQRQEFHAILRIGDYTFSKYKVIWKYIASEFICAVISTVQDPYLGEKLLLPNEKIMYVSIDEEMEAYYLCGMLSSTLLAECVKSYMNPTSISAHVLNKLKIPSYDASNQLHREIARLCREGHGKTDITAYIKQIDLLAAKLYEISSY